VSELNPLALLAMFLVPLLILAAMVLLKRLAIARGWIVKRREPTESELAYARLREALNLTMAEVGQALLPVVQQLAVSLSTLFPPLSRRERVLLWLDGHYPRWLNPWTPEYWLVMAGMVAVILLVGVALSR